MTAGEARERIIVAYDKKDREGAKYCVEKIGGRVGATKLGLEFILRHGAGGLTDVQSVSPKRRIFADCKLSDIPATVEGAAESILLANPWMFNVHAMAGPKAMEAARRARDNHARETGHQALVIAVTVLTSLDEEALKQIGVDALPLEEVVRLAKLAREVGLDGVVASPLEVTAVRDACGPLFKIVTPGIRLAGGATHDQARVATPGAAIRAGSDFLVIGRAISEAENPFTAIDSIAAEIVSAVS